MGKLCIEWEGEVSLVDYDADGNVIHKQPVDGNVIPYAVRDLLVKALDEYLEATKEKDQAEEAEEG